MRTNKATGKLIRLAAVICGLVFSASFTNAATAVQTDRFINGIGTNNLYNGVLIIAVFEAGKDQLGFKLTKPPRGQGSASYTSTEHLSAASGWFIYVESVSKIWVVFGDQTVIQFVWSDNGPSFERKVPDRESMDRAPDEFKLWLKWKGLPPAAG